jgi:hypothetical protein
MKIELKKLELQNFKGTKKLEIEFINSTTRIFGKNATGKTTIFDAMTWLLFGKDSHDEKEFEIKTLDENGETIHHLEHIVVGTFLIDGQEKVFKKVHKEVWSIKTGEELSTTNSNKTSHYIDDLPILENRYKKEIAEILKEETFKLLTNPFNFSALHWTKRREILMSLSEVENLETIFALNSDFEEIREMLEKHGIDDSMTIFKDQKKKTKKLVEDSKVKINENDVTKHDLTELDVNDLSAAIVEIEEEIKELEESTKDNSSEEALNILKKEKEKIALEITAKENEITAKENEITAKENEKEKKVLEMQGDSLEKIEKIREDKSVLEKVLAKDEKEIDNIFAKKEANVVSIKNLELSILKKRDEFAEKSGDEIQEVDKFCETCKQEIPQKDLKTIIENHKTKKAAGLLNITEAGKKLVEEKKREEKEKDERLAGLLKLNKELQKTAKEIKTKEEEILKIKEGNKISENEPILLKIKKEIETLETGIKGLEKDIENLQKENEEKRVKESNIKNKENTGNSEILGRIQDKKDEKEEVQKELNKFTENKNKDIRIEELKKEEKELLNKFNALEKKIFLTEEFVKIKAGLVEKEVNLKFKHVSFKLFKILVNGGLEETCEIMYKGVPFSKNLNNGAMIKAGVDIINTLSKKEGVEAPIFIDNKESITEVLETDAQMIELIVSAKDEKLRIEQ